MDSPKKKPKRFNHLNSEDARAEIEKRIRRFQRRIAITANPRIKKWAEKALSLGRYQDCYWILKIESRDDPDEYAIWIDWLKRLEKTLV